LEKFIKDFIDISDKYPDMREDY